jgi:hypothetical protein
MSAGVAERPLDGCDLSITRCWGASGGGVDFLRLGQTIPAQMQAMGVVSDPIEAGVGAVAVPVQDENRAPLRKPTTTARLNASYRIGLDQ